MSAASGKGLPRIPFHAATRQDRARVDPTSVKSYVLIGVPGGAAHGDAAAQARGASGANGAASEVAHAPTTWLFPPESMHSLASWQDVGRVGAGLKNLGNTCFLNAALQCLCYTPPLANLCLRRTHSQSCSAPGFCAYCELEKHMVASFARSGGSIVPQAIVRNLRSIGRQFRVGRQEDSHEFLRYFVDKLQLAAVGVGVGKLASNGAGGAGGGGAASPRSPKVSPALAETSEVGQIFGGRLRSRVLCTRCGTPSDTFDPFLDLSLELARAGSVSAALRKFTEPELLDGKNAYRCGTCKQLTPARKALAIEREPLVLALQLKRFGVRGGKINGHVAFDETLDLRPYSSRAALGGSEQQPQPQPQSQSSAAAAAAASRYDLYAVLVHMGTSVNSGHYFAFVRASSGVWYCMDDERVRQVSLASVLKAQAYCLFYVRKPGSAARPSPASPAPAAPAAQPAGMASGLGGGHPSDRELSGAAAARAARGEEEGSRRGAAQPARADADAARGGSERTANGTGAHDSSESESESEGSGSESGSDPDWDPDSESGSDPDWDPDSESGSDPDWDPDSAGSPATGQGPQGHSRAPSARARAQLADSSGTDDEDEDDSDDPSYDGGAAGPDAAAASSASPSASDDGSDPDIDIDRAERSRMPPVRGADGLGGGGRGVVASQFGHGVDTWEGVASESLRARQTQELANIGAFGTRKKRRHDDIELDRGRTKKVKAKPGAAGAGRGGSKSPYAALEQRSKAARREAS